MPRTDTLDRRARGAAIEDAARRHLVAAGLRELAANASYRGGELDLVMRDDGGRAPCVVFVEVRYRRSDGFGGGAASVDAGKRRRLLLAAQSFLAAHPALRDAPCRFDVIEASGDPAAPTLRWLRDAFRADDC
ncbi:MAG TPA: YraN family protein [Xanthomonadaceae bacterium]|nr:YraN family protein [Xanthomonadaceae bacterium]